MSGYQVSRDSLFPDKLSLITDQLFSCFFVYIQVCFHGTQL